MALNRKCRRRRRLRRWGKGRGAIGGGDVAGRCLPRRCRISVLVVVVDDDDDDDDVGNDEIMVMINRSR